jgi:nicotinate-nucleotide adenylyltransferase
VRLGIFGGSFDPPHLGHLLPVIDAAETLGLDAVRFVPAGEQPFKVGTMSASAAHRFAMTERLVLGIPAFGADSAEIDRRGLSYSVDTVAQMRALYPAAELVLLLGVDAFASSGSGGNRNGFRRWQRLLSSHEEATCQSPPRTQRCR